MTYSYTATIRNGDAKAEVSASDPSTALRMALTRAKNRPGFEAEQLNRMTAMDALDLCASMLRSLSVRSSFTPSGGYTFSIEKEMLAKETKRAHVGQVTRRKDGTLGLLAFKREISDGIGMSNFGGWKDCDIGKHVFRVGSIYQMENEGQYQSRVLREREEINEDFP